MLLLQLVGPEYFRYERDWLATGQVWRLVTAHWVHVGWVHLLLNAASLVICVTLTSPRWSIKRWLIYTLIMGLGISILIDLYNPEIGDYAGHSGVLYGLYLLAAINLFARDRLIAVLVLIAIVGKVLMEKFEVYDFNTGDLIGARVVTDSHLYGLLMGFAIALVWATYTMNHGSTQRSN